jgi:hypothetical protein
MGGNALVPTRDALTEDKARAVQYGIWINMGYQTTEIFGLNNPAQYLYDSWFALGGAYDNDWAWQNKPVIAGDDFVPFVQLALLSGTSGGFPYAQEQAIFNTAGSLPDVPEPASIAIWALIGGMGAAGVAMKRRKNRHGRWSDENRQAIMSIIER